MKVLANGAGPAMPMAQPPQQTPTSAEVSFAGLLHDDIGLVVPAQRQQSMEAMRFDALGVFGRYGAAAENRAGFRPAPGGEQTITPLRSADGINLASTHHQNAASPLLYLAFQNTASPPRSTSTDPHTSTDQSTVNPLSYAAIRDATGSLEQVPANVAASAYEVGATPAVAESCANRVAVPAVRDSGPINDEVIPSDDLADARLEPEQPAKLFEAAETLAADGPALEQLPEFPQGNSDASVSILGADSALNVIVRGNFLQEGNLPLREMVENTAAEFGMRVSGLRHNGLYAKSPTTASGDPNGSRTR